MQLALTRNTDTKIKVEVFDDEGNIQIQRFVNRYSTSQVEWLSRLTQWVEPETTQHLNEAADCDTECMFDVDIPKSLLVSIQRSPEVDTDSLFTISVRNINSPRTNATPYQDVSVEDALKSVFEDTSFIEPVLEWVDSARLSCLDIDYHDMDVEVRPTREQLDGIVRKIKPQPFCWHPSHAGGAKLYYVGTPGYGANELASIAGLMWSTIDPRSTFDVLNSSRHPCYARQKDNRPAPCSSADDIEYLYGLADISSIRRLLTYEVNNEELSELLSDRGWVLGSTLPHSECPINPDGREERLSVFLGESGVYCHSCAARGTGHGKPGCMPYAMLIQSRKTDSRLASMVKHFCHYEHAKVILSNLYKKLNEKCLSNVYRVLLKVYHQDNDPRIDMAMMMGRGVIRLRGTWAFADGTALVSKNIDAFVKSLPSVLIPQREKEKIKYTVNTEKMVAFTNAGDLSDLGYPDVTFIRGCQIYGHHLPTPSDENIKIIVRKEFRNCVPTYLPSHKRMGEKEVWAFIEDMFPGIDRNYLKLIIAAKGCSEGRLAQCPFLMVTGISGAGKSTIPHIAEGICGGIPSEPIFTGDMIRFRQAVMDAASDSGVVVLNEIFKEARACRLSPLQALNPMLNITEESRSHVMFRGSVPFGRLPLFILTDIECPQEIFNDTQIERRFTFYRLHTRNKWEDNLIKVGKRPHQFRLISGEHAHASDSLLSMVIDEFFTEPHSLKDIAATLEADSYGVEIAEEKERSGNIMREFYEEVCRAPASTDKSHKQQYNPEFGWKIIKRNGDNSRLFELWSELADGNTDDMWYTSRKIASEDWKSVIGVDFPVQCRYTPNRAARYIVIRFNSIDTPQRKKHKWYNGRFTTT